MSVKITQSESSCQVYILSINYGILNLVPLMYNYKIIQFIKTQQKGIIVIRKKIRNFMF